MKEFIKLTCCLLAFILMSCSKQSIVEHTGSNGQGISTSIKLEDALTSLDKLLVELKETTTKSSLPSYSTSDISVVGMPSFPKTKGIVSGVDVPDTLLYIVNFNDSEGFAVLAGDTRLGIPVYCITEKGSISSEDFSQAYDYINSSLAVTKTDTVDDGSFVDLGPTFVPTLLLSSMLADLKYGLPKEDLETKATSSVITFGTVLLNSKWHQKTPFNELLPFKSNSTEHCPAGCVAIACAQIMNYCRRPANPVFEEVSCSWDAISTVAPYDDLLSEHATNAAKFQTAKFLKHIGGYDYCRISYGEQSGGYADGAKRTLSKYGYLNVSKYLGFGAINQSKASAMLRDGKPVYLDGSDYHNGGGHAWVIDGEWNGHFHCNWGWNGDWDGYYAKHNYFPISGRACRDSKDSGDTDSSVAHHDFDWNFRLITYNL